MLTIKEMVERDPEIEEYLRITGPFFIVERRGNLNYYLWPDLEIRWGAVRDEGNAYYENREVAEQILAKYKDKLLSN